MRVAAIRDMYAWLDHASKWRNENGLMLCRHDEYGKR